MQPEPYGLHQSVAHRPDFFLESEDGHKLVVDVVNFDLPLSTAMTTNSAALGAAARAVANSKRRQNARLYKNLYGLTPFSMEPHGCIDSSSVPSLHNYATSPSGSSGSPRDYMRDFNRALRRGSTNVLQFNQSSLHHL